MSEHENADKHFELAVTLSRDTLKALLLVNGGAATALIAMMDKSNNSKDYTWAIILFGAGTVGAVISSCFGYFSQLHYANHRVTGESHAHKMHQRWQATTLIAVALTLTFGIAGIVTAALIARP